MKVLQVELLNFKKHEDLSLDVKGRNIFLLGQNEVGKSSILDSIFFALNPAKETAESKIPEPLTTGKKAGHVKVVVGSDNKKYTVTRKFTEGSDDRKLTIVTQDGMSTTKADMLEGLIGYRKVNPFEFVSWGATADGRRKQLQLIESLLSPQVIKELVDIKNAIALQDEKVKTANAEKTSLSQALNALGVTEHDLLMHSEPINIVAEMDNLKKLHAANSDHAKVVAGREEVKTAIHALDKQIVELEEALDKARLARGLREDQYAKQTDWLEANPLKPTADIETKINEAQTHNNRNALVVKHAETCEKLKTAEQGHARLKEGIEELQKKRKDVIAANKLPIPGLTFDADQVYLHGLPLHDRQLSTSQIMRLSFAIALATVKDDKLKLLCIPRGESLDNNAIADLKLFLKENPDWQCFIEEVDRDKDELTVEYFESL